MVENSLARPDITITLDADGVIRGAQSSGNLSSEPLDGWVGRPWGETIDPKVGETVAQVIGELRDRGSSSFLNVLQRFPSGLEVPMEYTTFSLGEKAGFIAIGKNLQVISDLKSRLVQAQKERERDYWKIREIETRYRMLFDSATEAAVLVHGSDLRIVESNKAAMQDLALTPGSEFLPGLQPHDRKSLNAMLDKVRESGRAPSIALHLPPGNTLYSLRASLMNSESGLHYLFQLAPIGLPAESEAAEPGSPISIEELIGRLPDGIAIVDRDGLVRYANATLMDMIHVGAETAIVGQPMKRWLSEPGTDMSMVASLVQKHEVVRRMSSVLHGELGLTTQIEISAAGNRAGKPDYICLVIRDATNRQTPAADAAMQPGGDVPDLAGHLSLEQLVRASTEMIERRTIVAVLEQCDDNRTLAAKRLGLSRQSLHAKLKKYNLERRLPAT